MTPNRRQFLVSTGIAAGTASVARAAVPAGAAGLSVTGLKAEGLEKPLGLGTGAPRLSWQIAAPNDRGVKQAAWRVVATTAAGQPVWDSGWQQGDETLDRPWGGRGIDSRQRVNWTVSVKDDRGREATSAPSWFETGMLTPGDWHAQWIEAEDESSRADRLANVQWIWSETALDPRPHGFRLNIDAPADIVGADVMISGKDDLIGVWVNGEQTTLPAKTFWGTLMPIPATLKPGRNSVCVLVQAETSGFFPVDGGAMAALVRLHRKNGETIRIASGPNWRVMPNPPQGWTAPGFEAKGWIKPVRSGSRAQNDPRPTEPAMLLRRSFDVGRPIARARLYATALGAYDARINGRRVTDAHLMPELSVARDHLYYQSYDVTPLVRSGENAIGVVMGDGWYAGAYGWHLERYGFGPAPRRLMAELHIDYADGGHGVIATGPEWRIGPSPILTSEVYHGETFDARLHTQGWDAPGFDNAKWSPVRVGKAATVPLLAQPGPLLRPLAERRAGTITEPVPGVFVLDFGQNFAGWCHLKARGSAGTTITLRFAELLLPDGRADQSNLRGAKATDQVTLRGDAEGESWEPHFTYHGFRYVEVSGFPGKPTPEDIVGIVVHSDCPETGTLTIGSALLQKFWLNALWSQRSNFFAVPTDCPQRDERMGWMGDIQVFLDAACYNMDSDAFIRRFLDEVRAAQTPEGAYPIVVPQPLSFPDVVTAGWSEAGIILPWTLWQRYGDTRAIEDNWAAMERWMGYVARHNPDGVWRKDRGLDLGDWLSVDAVKPDDETTPRVLCATAYWAYVAQLMSEMATATGRTADAQRYTALRAKIGTAFAREFVRSDGQVGNGSQTSYVLALRFGLVPDGQRQAAADKLAADIHRRNDTLSTGFLGTPYLLDVLADNGHHETVVALLLQTRYPSWGYMVAKGATTMWERWNGDHGDLSMNSYNHYAFGAMVGFLYRRMAGIAPAAPGFRTIRIDPFYDARIGAVAMRYQSCLGQITSRIDGDANGPTRIELEIPANATAELVLPKSRIWREGRRTLSGPTVALGSGKWSISTI
jgi:alpha-L-rhamnosidase